ncbi:MAG: hypothetical protein ACRCZ9_10395 [Fusobacteriaceae bacterium]
MDTISLTINFNLFKILLDMGKGNSANYIKSNLEKELSNLESPSGYTFLTVTNFNMEKGFSLKISYPRYFAGTNAYLISTREECYEVQQFITNYFLNHEYFKYISSLFLVRVDIPFTYHMEEKQFFHHYDKIYKVLAHVYTSKNKEYTSKSIGETITDQKQTVIYSSTKNPKDCHSKVQMYNQYLNLKTKESDNFPIIIEDFPDLSKRIRIEVCKKVNREAFTVQEFSNFDILGHYLEDYREYLLTNLFDMAMIERLYESWARELAAEIEEEREKRGINYTTFFLERESKIYDYEVIRRSLIKAIPNISTRENAITKIRKILKEYEEKHGYIILKTYKIIESMTEIVGNSFILLRRRTDV